VEALEARRRRGDPSGGLTLGREAVRWASSGGSQSSAAALGVRRARGLRVRGVMWRGGGELPYIGSGRRGGGRRGGEWSTELQFKGDELRGRLLGRGRGGGSG
jgi:hypothetical protein